MPYDLRIIRSRDFVQLDAEGHFDMPATQKLFSDVIWACVRSKVGRVLVDIRDATANLTTAQLAALANVCREITPPGDEHKVAILTRAEAPLQRASFVAGLAKDEGWNIGAFSDFEGAFTWLIT